MNTSRQIQILQILIEKYKKDKKPVSSFYISEKLNLSASLIRNELQKLRKENLIEKTSISSGSIPTDKGYEFIIENTSLILNENNNFDLIIEKIDALFKKRNQDIDNTLEQSYKIISQFTKTLFIKEKQIDPKLILINITFNQINKNQLLVIFAFSNGQVESEIITNEEISNDLILSLEIISNQLIKQNLEKVEDKINEIIKHLNTQIKSAETYFLNLIKSKIINLKNNSVLHNKVENFEIINFIQNEKDLNLLKEMLNVISSNTSILELLQIRKSIKKKDTLIALDFENEAFLGSSIIQKTYLTNFNKQSFYLFGDKNQNYDLVLKIIDFIDKKISENN